MWKYTSETLHFFLKKIDVSQGRIIVLHKVEVNTPLEENDSQIHE